MKLPRSVPADHPFSNLRYKREAYRHSEYAPRILADEGIRVVMKVRLRALVDPNSKVF